MSWINSFGGYVDFITYVFVQAPDNFPEEDFLSEADQMNLDRAFYELRQGIHFVEDRIPDKSINERLHQLLEESISAYKDGNDVGGAHLLQDMQNLILEKNP